MNNVREFEEGLLAYVKDRHPQLRDDVVAKKKIDEEFGARLKQVIADYKRTLALMPDGGDSSLRSE